MLKQINILFKSAFTNNKQSLEKLADEIDAIVKKRGGKTYKMNESKTSINTSLYDFNTVFMWNMKNISISNIFDELSFFVTLALYHKTIPYNEKPRYYIATITNVFPTCQIVQNLLQSAGLPKRYMDISTNAIYSALRVYILRKTCGYYSHSLVNFATSVLAIMGLNIVSTSITKKILKSLNLSSQYNTSLITTLVNLTLFPIAHYIGLYGVRYSIVKFFDSLFLQYYKKHYRETTNLNFEPDEVPDSMKCPICNDLLTEPQEIDGFLFCKECLYHWATLYDKPLHPATGLPMVIDSIKPNTPMLYVMAKYKKILQDEHDRQQDN